MTIVSGVLLALALVCLLAALALILRAVGRRGRAANAAYSVGRQELRHDMQVDLVRGAAFLLLSLIVWAVFGLSVRTEQANALSPTMTPTISVTVAATRTATAVPTPTGTHAATTNTPLPSPTTPPDIPTQTPSPSPTPTETPKPPTALVNSPNGLYLRERPGGTQEIELIPDGTELILLPGRQTENDLEWQQVRTPLGNEGWVAVDFIIYQQ